MSTFKKLSKKFLSEKGVGLIELPLPPKGDFITLNNSLISKIVNEAKHFQEQNSINVIYLTSAAKNFCTGANLDDLKNDCKSSLEKIDELRTLDKPLVAAVKGFTLGGGFELALICDVIIAAKNTIFGFPEVNLGLIPGLGGISDLVSLTGKKYSFEVMATGRRIRAEEALRKGIVTKVVEKEDLEMEAAKIAMSLASKNTESMCALKKCLSAQNLRMERGSFLKLFSKFKNKN